MHPYGDRWHCYRPFFVYGLIPQKEDYAEKTSSFVGFKVALE